MHISSSVAIVSIYITKNHRVWYSQIAMLVYVWQAHIKVDFGFDISVV